MFAREFSSRRAVVAVALFALLTTALFSVPLVASLAAAGTISAVSQSLINDGTAPFDSVSGDGLDTGSSNGVIRTHDTFDITWTYVVVSAGDITLTQTLVNGIWSQDSTGLCAQGLAAISSDKKTITCTLLNQSVGSGSYTVRGIADGRAGNGATISGAVRVGSLTSNGIALTVSATPKMNISTMDLFASAAQGPGAFSSVSGYNVDVPVSLWAPISGSLVDGRSGVLGLESLANSFTFDVVPDIAGAELVSCSRGPAGGTRPVTPGASGGDGASVINAVRDSGVWACAPGANGRVTVTVTGADSSLNSYPTRSANNDNITAAKRAFFSTGSVRLWIPKSATTPNATTRVTTKIENFDPSSVSGASNYGATHAPNQPSASCASDVQNCSAVVINRVFQGLLPEVRLFNEQRGLLPGSSTSWDGLGQVIGGTKFIASALGNIPNGNDVMTNPTVCLKWNPTQAQIDPNRLLQASAGSLTAVVEYGTASYPTQAQLDAPDCGRPGGATANWFSSVAAAGGPSAITAVRVTFQGQVFAGSSYNVDVPLTAQSAQTPGQVIPMTAHASSAEIAASASTKSSAIFAEARVATTLSWDQPTSGAPETRTLTVTPQLLSGATARGTKVTVTLPSPCFSYVNASATVLPTTVTPANLGADGLACTSDDVSGARFEFNLGDISTAPSPISLRVNIDGAIHTPRTVNATATIVSASQPTATSGHSAAASLVVSTVAGFSLSKTADVGRVREASPFNYSINWRNTSTQGGGRVQIVDVLPFAGDSRGNAGFTQMTLNSVTAAGATVEYSSLSAADALTLVGDHPDGEHANFAWTTTKPAAATAVRITVANLATGASGSATLNVSVSGVQSGGSVKNDLYGVAAFAALPLRAALPLEIPTLGSTSMTTSLSANLSEVTSAGQALVYTATITNTGQEALSALTVTTTSYSGSASSPVFTCASTFLFAGQSVECVSAPVLTSQADIDTKTHLTQAIRAVAKPPVGSDLENTDSVTTPIRSVAGLTLYSHPFPTAVTAAGTQITFTYTLTNSGTRSLNSIALNRSGHNGSAALGAVSCPTTALAPNATVDCTATYTVSQNDLDTLTRVQHQVSATATDSRGSSVTSNDTQPRANLAQQAALQLVKTANVASFNTVGATVQFTFTITNSGNVTLTAAEPQELRFSGSGSLGQLNCPADRTLSPNEQLICTASYAVTQSDLDAGFVTNRAVAQAQFGATSVNSAESQVTVPASGITPGITIDTSADLEFVDNAGTQVLYTVTLTNTGNVTLNSTSVSVTSFTATEAPGAVSCPSTTIAPQATLRCTVSYTVTQTDVDTLSQFDLGTAVTAQTAANQQISATATVVEMPVDPVDRLDVSATPSVSAVTQAGQVIVFALKVENSGQRTMTGVTAAVASGSFSGSGVLGLPVCPTANTLLPGEWLECTLSYTVTQSDVDTLAELNLTANAFGSSRDGMYDSSLARDVDDSTSVAVAALASLSLSKNSSDNQLDASGETLTYTFEVTNTGTRTLSGVTVEETAFSGSAQISAIDCPATASELRPGESAVCQADYVAVTADMSAVSLVNTARATSSTLNTVSPNSIATVLVKQNTPTPANTNSFTATLESLTKTGFALGGTFTAAAAALASGVTMLLARRRGRHSSRSHS